MRGRHHVKRNLRTFKSVLITGATGAIGSALARRYAQSGITLILHGRNQGVLEQLAGDCRALGATVVSAAFDVTDIPRLQQWIHDVDREHALELVILNHGINIHAESGQEERWDDIDQLIDVNVRATLALTGGVLPGMRRRGAGQIALISSLAAYFGLPMTPSYCASKAAVKAYGEGLRAAVERDGIGVTVVMPGYVDSAMCRAMPGPKPFLLTADRAAALIEAGVARNDARVSFPFPLNLGTWLLAVLPASVSIRLLRWMGYRA
jgi:short-subunit dehydrogenase